MGAAIFYVVAGSLHFIKPATYLRIMPPYIPWPAGVVRLSGAFEILGGLGLFVPATRRAAAWGLVALLSRSSRPTFTWRCIPRRPVQARFRRRSGGGVFSYSLS